jgi:hypothetical protein
MAGQTPSRREVLEALGLAAFASVAPGFCRWSSAQETMGHPAAALVAGPAKGYVPVGFAAGEYATIEVLCDRILPSDGDSPGAARAGVAEFIDFFVSTDAALAAQFRAGLDAFESLSRRVGGRPFVDLHEAQQMEMLKRLAYRANHRPGDERAREFFHLARKYTVMGFYTSEAGFKALDSPNLKFYAESPGCTHPDDPEHRLGRSG